MHNEGKTKNFNPKIQEQIDSQMMDNLRASDNKNATGKADFSNRTWAHVGGISMGKKWDKCILEENKPVLSNINGMKAGVKDDSFIPPKKDKIEIAGIGPEVK